MTEIDLPRVGYTSKVTKLFEETIMKDSQPLSMYICGAAIWCIITVFTSFVLLAMSEILRIPSGGFLHWVVGSLGGGFGYVVMRDFLNVTRAAAVKELLVQAREWEKRADLWSLFPPTQEQADAKLEALALTIRELGDAQKRMEKMQGEARLGSRVTTNSIQWRMHVCEQTEAYLEVYELLRQLAPHIKLLPSWIEYVHLYDARVKKSLSSEVGC